MKQSPRAKAEPGLHTLRTHKSYQLYAGKIADQRQVLMGLACPDLITCFFDKAGEFLESQTRHLEFLKPSGASANGESVEGQLPPYDIDDVRISERMLAWQTEIKFVPKLIKVKAFFLSEQGIGIEHYPRHFLEVLNDPNEDEAAREGMRELMRLWDADRQFVLLWGNDYWLDDDGDVVSS